MPKRSFAMALAMALFASLALSAPSQAGYVTTVSALNGGPQAADDLEVIFANTGGPVSNIKVTVSGAPVGSADPISSTSGWGVEINFSSPLAVGSGVAFTFDSTSAPTGIISAEWTYKTTPPSSAPAPLTSIIGTTATVPEPASMALLGIGMAGFLSFRRFFKRKAVV